MTSKLPPFSPVIRKSHSHALDARRYGGPTPMPTSLPTPAATSIFLPMEAYPFRANYNYLIYTSFAFALGGVVLFVMTRIRFNAAEERSPGKWPI